MRIPFREDGKFAVARTRAYHPVRHQYPRIGNNHNIARAESLRRHACNADFIPRLKRRGHTAGSDVESYGALLLRKRSKDLDKSLSIQRRVS